MPSADALIAAVRTQLGSARSAHCIVVHLQHDGGSGTPDEPETRGWQLALPVASGEPVLRKTKDDGFEGTNLGEILSRAGVRTLSICGVSSEMCVAATTRGALARGLTVTMARDAHGTYPVPEHGPSAPPFPAHLLARVAEWSLGDEPVFCDHSADLKFARPQCP